MPESLHLTPAEQARLAEVARADGEARGLPNDLYVCERMARLERERLFARSWVCIGRGADLPAPGDLAPYDLYGLGLLAVRDDEGRIGVYHNVCSHRGRRLVVAPCGTRGGLIRCPYHSWTYGLDGRLRGTPHAGGVGRHTAPVLERERHGLVAVRSATWLDLIFVNLSATAPPFERFVAPLANRCAALFGDDGPRLLRPDPAGRLRIEVAANWKLAVENYCESYHLPWVHPGLNGYSRLEDHYALEAGVDFCGQGVRSYRFGEVQGVALPRFPSWDEGRLRVAEYPVLMPNLLLGIQADHVFTLLVQPLAPARTAEDLCIYYVGDEALDERFAAARARVFEGWRAVFAEDVAPVEEMQIGRGSPAFDGGVFTPVLDQPTHHFHRWVAHRLTAESGTRSVVREVAS